MGDELCTSGSVYCDEVPLFAGETTGEKLLAHEHRAQNSLCDLSIMFFSVLVLVYLGCGGASSKYWAHPCGRFPTNRAPVQTCSPCLLKSLQITSPRTYQISHMAHIMVCHRQDLLFLPLTGVVRSQINGL